MRCASCGGDIRENAGKCTACGTAYVPLCADCGYPAVDLKTRGPCPNCGGEMLPVWNPTVDELLRLGIRCFLPYTDDRIYDIYLGGNRDGGGYVFHNTAGYTGPPVETLVLPSLVEGRPIVGIWNEFFCTGNDFAPEAYDRTFERMYPIKNIIVSEGIREAGIYAFFGCCGLKTLVLPKSMKKMMYDFADLFAGGLDSFPNGRSRGPVTVRYRGGERDWAKVAVPNLFNDFVNKAYVKLEFDCED